MTVPCVSVLCCVRAVCLSSCENKPQHTAQEPQTHQNFESLKIINSRDDNVRFEVDQLIPKRAAMVRINFQVNSNRRHLYLTSVNGRLAPSSALWVYVVKTLCSHPFTRKESMSRRLTSIQARQKHWSIPRKICNLV